MLVEKEYKINTNISQFLMFVEKQYSYQNQPFKILYCFYVAIKKI